MALTKHNFLHFIYLEFGLDEGKSCLPVLFFWLIPVLRWLRQKVSQHNVYFKEETIISKLEVIISFIIFLYVCYFTDLFPVFDYLLLET